jgi:predicted MFS family arabinose efflux permease
MNDQAMHAPQSSAQDATARYTWYVILLLTVVNVLNYMDRMALSVLMPYIKTDLGLSDGRLGLLTGFAFFVFYALCGIPIARWADRGIRRNIVAIALGVWSTMTALSGAAQNFWHLFAARVGVGAGEAGCIPPSQSMICDYVPIERRAGIFAIHSFGIYAGMMVGMGLSGWLGEVIGWRWAFAILGLPGIGVALLVRLTLREPPRGRFDVRKSASAQPPLAQAIVALWRCRTYRVLMAFLVVNGFVQNGLNQWWPSFYSRVFGMSVLTVGVKLGVAIGVGCGAGLLLGGLLANKAAQRDLRLPLFIGAGATSLALPAALASLFASTASASILLVALTALLWSVSNGPVVATVNSVVPSSMRALAGALTVFVTSLLGFGLGPFCVGMLSDLLLPSFGHESLRYALLAPVLGIPLMCVALYAAAGRLKADLQAESAHADPEARAISLEQRGDGLTAPPVFQNQRSP